MIQYSAIGSSIMKAVQLEKKQEWSGCIVDDEAILKFTTDVEEVKKVALNPNQLCDIQYLLDTNILARYPAPLKGTKPTVMHVINWCASHPQEKSRVFTENIIREAFTLHNKTIGNDASNIIKNTVRFADEMQ